MYLRNFFITCLKYYDLEPCHYFSAPESSWDAMLKMTGVTLEKISHPNKYMLFKQGMRGGVNTSTKDTVKHLKMSISFIWTWTIYMDVQ